MDDIEKQVQEATDRLVESGAQRGLQVAVYRHGEPVVDAVAGVTDLATGRPVTSDTPFFSFSIGKGVAATVAHVLAERDVFGYDTPIVELWPEFGAHGKETATVETRFAYPDWTLVIEDLVTKGDWVTPRWQARGMHTGDSKG